MEITPTIHKGGDSVVNWYAVEQGGKVTLVDAGLPRNWSQVASVLAAMGRKPSDIEAVLLTHAHIDHIGFAEKARTELGATVRAHTADAAVAEGKAAGTRVAVSELPLWKPALWKFLYVMVRGGATKPMTIGEVVSAEDGEVLDVPGRPRLIHTPGHTPGSAAYFFADHRALFSGDTLVTMAVTGGSAGPQIMPDKFHADPMAVRQSAAGLASIDASIVLPGHGPAFEGSPSDAVSMLS
ncbi:MAG: MBL fold metallo-hydrolase [Acidimicrobiia bacterium]|nr:MBL fold metallo-hydrolase [Acidimicrobiia bacterium]